MQESPYAFVSYSHSDSLRVFRIVDRLESEGYRLWCDKEITPAETWNDETPEVIANCNLFIIFITRVSVERKEIRKEITYAQKCDKAILAIHLELTDLPREVSFMLDPFQAVYAYNFDEETVMEKVRMCLVRHGVTGSPMSERAEKPSVKPRSRKGMPQLGGSMDRLSITDAFANRVSEAAALQASVEHQMARLSEEEPIVKGVYPNVLVFYGGTGMGKTGLSLKLQEWASRGGPSSGEWGPWPHRAVVPIRWDFYDSGGNLDMVSLLVSLRGALLSSKFWWAPLDLGIATYLTAMGSDSLTALPRLSTAILHSLCEVAAKLGMGLPSELTPDAVLRISDRVQEDFTSITELCDFDALQTVLEDCEEISRGVQKPEVFVHLMYLLTQQIFFIDPEDRPPLVFFIDHFERIQLKNETSEALLCAAIINMPYCLFVVTGRDKLNWCDPRQTDLPEAGLHSWFGLADGAREDPRQHLLGRLSDEDTLKLYNSRRTREGLSMSDEVIAALVQRSNGLPLHVEAVLKVAHNIHVQDPDREMALADLDGDLPQVVEKLMMLLTPVERDTFRAACVLPFFDIELVRHIAGVKSGSVERVIKYALVESNPDSVYPYRVHDEIRRLIRCDHSSQGFWGADDWREAALRGFAEAQKRIEAARETETDEDDIQAIALAIRLAYEWDLPIGDLPRQVTQGPTMLGLAGLLPAVSELDPVTESSALIRFIQAIMLPTRESIPVLNALTETGTPVDPVALRFCAYRMRAAGQIDQAVSKLNMLIDRFPDERNQHIGQHQIAITLRIGRRFVDALAYAEQYEPENKYFVGVVQNFHGIYDQDPRIVREAIESEDSLRVRFEMETTNIVRRALSSSVAEEEVQRLLAKVTELKARGDMADCMLALGYLYLARPGKFEPLLDRLREHLATYNKHASGVVQLLVLKALMTGDSTDAQAAYDAMPPGPSRTAAWIRIEVWLEALGHPLPPVETQWIIPYDQVRENWMNIAYGVIERAKALAEADH